MQGIIAALRSSLETLKAIKARADAIGAELSQYIDEQIAKYEALIERLENTFASASATYEGHPTALFAALPPAHQEWVADFADELWAYVSDAE